MRPALAEAAAVDVLAEIDLIDLIDVEALRAPQPQRDFQGVESGVFGEAAGAVTTVAEFKLVMLALWDEFRRSGLRCFAAFLFSHHRRSLVSRRLVGASS